MKISNEIMEDWVTQGLQNYLIKKTAANEMVKSSDIIGITATLKDTRDNNQFRDITEIENENVEIVSRTNNSLVLRVTILVSDILSSDLLLETEYDPKSLTVKLNDDIYYTKNSCERCISYETYVTFCKKYKLKHKDKTMAEMQRAIYKYEKRNEGITDGLYFI